MLRVLTLFLALVAIAAAAAWLADNPGTLAIDWRDYRIETSIAVALTALLLMLIALIAVYRFWHFLARGPGAFAEMRAESRRAQGLSALNKGMLAIAVGDAEEAQRQAKRSAKLLDDPTAGALLTAQAAQLSGDETAARESFDAMRENTETELLGLRGLLADAQRKGERSRAKDLARRAYELKPSARWAMEELFLLEAQAGNWPQARGIAAAAGKARVLDLAEAKRREAILLLAEARDAEAAGESRRALDLARRAHGIASDLVPATLLAARLHAAAGERRRARKMLEDGWQHGPHRDILRDYLLLEGGKDDDARSAAAKRLTGGQSAHAAGAVLAEFALHDEDYEAMERHLAPTIGPEADRQECLMMATLLENGRRDGAGARVWLRRASEAPGEPAWICQNCGHTGHDWFAVCAQCGRFGTADWQRPARPPALAANLEPARLTGPGVASSSDDSEGVPPLDHEKRHPNDIAPTASRP